MAPTQEHEPEYQSYSPASSIEISPSLESISTTPTTSRSNLTESDVGRSPIDPFELIKFPVEDNLAEILLKATGSDGNLECIEEVKLKVIAPEVGLQHLSAYTPQLRELTLDGSVVTSLRDLGCGLKSLRILKVNRCGLNSLDGILGMQNLQELYADFNCIEDVSPCTGLEKINFISVKRNKLKDIYSLSFLSLCESLNHLILEDNPAITDLIKYREIVKSLLPNLKTLDDIDYLADGSLRKKSDQEKFEEESNKCTLPPIENKPRLGSSRLNAGASSSGNNNCSYSVSFSPRVLSPRVNTTDVRNPTDIKVDKTELPKI